MGNDKVKLSIIVPVYNVERYLKECLDSIIKQTLKEIEIICVDDCGSDNSVDILDEYAKKDKRIKIIHHEKNKGLGEARNSGMQAANGEYIGFVDSDDFVDLNFFEKLYDDAKKYDADMVAGNVFTFDDQTGERLPSYSDRFFKIPVLKTLAEKINSAYSCSVWNKIYRKSMVDKYKLRFPTTYFEDVPFNFFMSLLSNIVIYDKNVFYHYRIRCGSIMNTLNADKKQFSIFKVFDFCNAVLNGLDIENDKKQEYKKILDNFEIHQFYGYLSAISNDTRNEFLSAMKDYFLLLNIENNEFIDEKTRKLYKNIVNDIYPISILRFKLFGFIPTFVFKKTNISKEIILFNLPLLTICHKKSRTKIYFFKFILILSIRAK